MKSIKALVALGCVFALLTGSTIMAADQPEKKEKKLTCCEEAAVKKKECTHKCCLAAHRNGKSCEKCNPHKEDLKLKKDARKADKKDEKTGKKPDPEKKASK